MTFFGSSQLEDQIGQYRTRLICIKQDIDNIVSDAEKGVGLADVKNLINKVTSLFEKYSVLAQEYESYLTGSRTERGAEEASTNQRMLSMIQNKVHDFVQRLENSLPVKSHASSRTSRTTSTRSGSSHVSAIWLQHTANVEKAKARLKFAAEEAELIKKEAEIKANKSLLSVKRELEEAESGLGAIRKALNETEGTKFGSQFGSYVSPQV